MVDDFNILARRVKHLQHLLVDHQVEQGGEVEAGCLAVDQHLGAVGGDLHEAKLRPEGLLAHELGIDRDERGAAELGACLFELVGTRDEGHGGRI